MPLTKIDDRGLNTPIDLLDNEKIRVGTGNDLHIYHDASHNVLESKNGEIRLMNNNDYMFRAVPGGANRLYFANSTKAETLSTGFMVNGHFDLVDSNQIRLGSSQDFKIYHDGTNSITFFDAQVGAVRFRTDIANNARSNIILGNGVDLYYNGVKKFETTSGGATVQGQLGIANTSSFGVSLSIGDSAKAAFGGADDLQIYHDGTNGNSIIDNNTGTFIVRSDGGGLKLLSEQHIILRDNDDTTNMIRCINNGQIELYYAGSKKLETVSTGILVTGKIECNDFISIAADNKKLKIGAGDDLEIYHSGSHTYLDNKVGHLYLRNHETNSNSIYATLKESGEFGIFKNGTSEWLIKTVAGGSTELWYDGSKKFETSSTGNLSTGVHKFITGSGSTASDDNVLHIVAGGTADRGIKIGTGRSTGASQNDGMGFIDAINAESGGYGSQLQLRVDGNRVMVIGYQGNNRVGVNVDHPTSRFHVVDDSTAESIKTVHSNGTAGIGIGYNTIQTLGSNTNQEFYIRAKGNEKLRLGANNADILGIEKDSRDVRFFTNAQGWSTQHFGMGGNYDMRVHRRRLNNGQNSVSTHNLFRLRRHNWGWGHFEIRLYETYYSGSYLTRCRVIGHGAGGNHYSIRTMADTWTNGGSARWGADVQIANASSNAPGDSTTYFCDVQATLPNYTFAVCELIMISGYQTNNGSDNGSMASNSYTLWTP